MPVAPTYPGVYVEEIPSGVRTITGVSTSVTAFVGSAKRGPINSAVHLLSYSDFERRFGGLAPDSELSYAVRQFFLNGGSDAWVVRLAKGAVQATRNLADAKPEDVLAVTALDAGFPGNAIEVRIDYATANPASTFNLTVNYASPDNPTDNVSETFTNLSMNSQDPAYVVDMVNGGSQLVKVNRLIGAAAITGAGTSISGDLTAGATVADVATLVDPGHNQFQVAVNGLPPVKVEFKLPADVAGADPAARLATLCSAIQQQVRAAAGGQPALANLTCAVDTNRIKLTSGVAGEQSSVRVLPGIRNDASGNLKLGTLNSGTEPDAAAAVRPVELPDHGKLISGTIKDTDVATVPDGTHNSLQISLDGYGPDTITLSGAAFAGANLGAKLQDAATRLQSAVRGVKPSNPAYKWFTCAVDAANAKLTLASGTRGDGSQVAVTAAAANTITDALHLVTDATRTDGKNVLLQGGSESSYTDADVYNLFIGDRSQRQGIFALEGVDIFNLLCLPGISDGGTLADADAYCKERRAFLIVDAPRTAKKPSEMSAVIAGTALPKSDHGAVYYPWIKIPDPLKAGRLRTSAPSGTIAGVYARTDSNRGVWKAAAGMDASLVGVQAVEYLLTDPENGTLNPLGVNCLRVFPVFGAVAWGSRTLRGADAMASEYKQTPVRRLALYIEESLYRGTKWVVFEPNDEPLWAQIRLNLGAFMHDLFRKGAFQGTTPAQAYFVKCDKETTTQNDINLGVVNIIVGFAPLKPAEFVIIQIQQIAGQVQA
jgi:phage tail sheath protein FI